MARTGIIAITVISNQNYKLAKEKGEEKEKEEKEA
jgi:hypothetical protein